MYAEVVVNIEAPLTQTFHYAIPPDLRSELQIGALVEVSFGHRRAQGIIVAFDETAPVPETKPIIAPIDDRPVVQPWQIVLARWLSQQYLAPLNACLRLMLPPGLSRWAGVRLDLDPGWEGSGRLTEAQELLVALLRERGAMRGRELARALPKDVDWKMAADQLVRRDILRRTSVLDPPRVRPKTIRTAELIAGQSRQQAELLQMGRANKAAEVLTYLLQGDDPLPAEEEVMAATGAAERHLQQLERAGLIRRLPAQQLVVAAAVDLAPAQYADLLSQLPASREQLALLQAAAGTNGHLLATLEGKGLVEFVEQPAAVGMAVPVDEALEQALALRGASVYHAILALLTREAQPVPVSEIYAATGAAIGHLRRLAERDLIRLGDQEVWRDPLADRDFVPTDAPPLTGDQARVWGRIKMAMLESEEKEPFLLHGVTGSGKTEIYMRAIDFAIEQGQTAIVLVPEIGLTPQTVRRFAARFPGRVAVLHSRLSDGERYDTWRRARMGDFDIVIGPRSALFTPLRNLGVIIIDEEHDESYKQTPPLPSPYYHAGEAAVALGEIAGATVILGSATPDLISYHRAQSGHYQLLELPRRIMGHRQRISRQSDRLGITSLYQQSEEDPDEALTIPLPPVQVVDLRQELRAGNRSIFSRALATNVDQTLARGEQAILFLNRRGTASFVLCRDCGHVVQCPRCDLPLTYHRPQSALLCHHCGYRRGPVSVCPQCGSRRIRHFGLGTEQVEELVQQRWPEARVVRWDRDTTAGRDSHEELLASFINHEADILIGTQMIAKGLDLPLVTLVGVISADVALGLPDHRTGERAFQLLTQVAGRAGRGLLGGRVIIQTYQPEHYAIQAAAEHDYASFYLEEIRFRTRHSLPPFRRLARLLISDPVDNRARRQAEQLAAQLRSYIQRGGFGASEVLGPVPPFFNRIDRRYRWQILLRSPDPVRLLADFSIPAPWTVVIDPVSTL